LLLSEIFLIHRHTDSMAALRGNNVGSSVENVLTTSQA